MVAWPQPLLAEMIAPDARLYADRNGMMAALAPAGGRVLEIGVGFGDFSEAICKHKQPKVFYAADLFELHLDEEALGQKAAVTFGACNHEEHIRSRLGPLVSELYTLAGPSSQTLKVLPSGTFDFIYVDGAHDFDAVWSDALSADRLLTPDGLVIFNDYVLFDPFLNAEYGVVEAVNRLLSEGGWIVVGFAFQPHMFCDIALRRGGSRR